MTVAKGKLGARWKPTPEQMTLMRDLFSTTRTQVLADRFGVKYHQVARLAITLGLAKDPAYLNGPCGGRADGTIGMGTRFQKGHATWIKGKRVPGHGDPSTWFQPGARPHNWKPVGSFRFAEGYLQIKVTDTGKPNYDWVMYHRYVWQRHCNGPIPRDYAVAFRGARQLEAAAIVPELLECVSKQELMRRHTFHQYGPEIVRLVTMRSALTRQINRQQERQSHEQD